tara:strand:+ start:29 stop:487 length:459 start_codon:yes stop_codon:yes gene_type:complete
MRKWHPASGDWGIFGRTAGRKEAEKSKKQIGGMISDVQGRKGGINQYFNELQNINTESNQEELLTGLENFLNESYNIKNEEDVRIKKQNFVDAFDPITEIAKEKIERDRKRFLERSETKFDLSRLDLGKKRESELFQIEDILRNLNLERNKY